MTKGKQTKEYNLESRTEQFAEKCIMFAKKLPKNEITRPLINQFIKASSSIGANYCEADCAESKKDFEHKIGISKKEAKESKYWLYCIGKAVEEVLEEAELLRKEAHELYLIFVTIVKNSLEKT